MGRGRRGSVQHNPPPKNKSSTDNGFDPNLLAAAQVHANQGQTSNGEKDDNANDLEPSISSSPRSTRFQSGGGGFLSGSSPLNRVLSSRSAMERRNQQLNNQNDGLPITPTESGGGLRGLDRWTSPFARKQQHADQQSQEGNGIFGGALTKSITDSSPLQWRRQQQQQQQQQQNQYRDGLIGNIYSNGDAAGPSRRDLSRYPTSTGTVELDFSPRSTNLRKVDTSNTMSGMARLEPLYTVDGSYSGSLYDNQHRRPNSGNYNSTTNSLMMPVLTRAQSASSVMPNRLTRNKQSANTSIDVDEAANFSPQDTLIYNALFGTKLPEGAPPEGYFTSSKADSIESSDSQNANFSMHPESSSNSVSGGSKSSRPMAMPKCDHHDVLWAEVDVMEEIESMSERIDKDDSFFGRRHADALDELRKAQLGLATALNDIDSGQLETSQHGWGTKAGENAKRKTGTKEGGGGSQQDNNNMPPRGFDHHYHLRDLDAIRENTFGQERFDDIQQAVDRVISKLSKVGDTMRDVEDTSGDVWNNDDQQQQQQRHSSKTTNQGGVGSLAANSAPSIAEQQ